MRGGAVGEGVMTFTSGSESFDISVSDTATLNDIRNSINDSIENTSISATIITDDNGQHLVLTSKETGLANEIRVSVAEVAQPGDLFGPNNTDKVGLSRLAYDTGALNLSEIREAEDAQITIDGTLVVSSSTNEFVDAIDGITITATQVHDVDDAPSIATTSENNSNIKLGLEEFVNSYNALVDLSKQLGQSGESAAGPLAGDSDRKSVV